MPAFRDLADITGVETDGMVEPNLQGCGGGGGTLGSYTD